MSEDIAAANDVDRITREITIDAPIEEVWEALSTDAGREGWLEPEEDRALAVEETDPPSRISWWWWLESDDEPARHVDVHVVSVPGGTRVTVTETQPAILPFARLSATLELVCV